MENFGQIFIYKAENALNEIEVRLENDTVWLNQQQMASLFEKDRTVITRHIRNIFRDQELDEESNVQKMHFPFSDKPIKYFNLDVIISVGYRVNSKKGVQFRIWANKVLKEYLLKGYALNEKQLSLQKEKFIQLDDAIKLISRITVNQNLIEGRHYSFFEILEEYSGAMKVLDDYDYNRIHELPAADWAIYRIEYNEVKKIINDLRLFWGNSDYFGREKDDSLKSSIAAIYQTYDGSDLYPSIVEKAANLLYFIVKNHSFIDGNKRIAAAIFLYFLEKNKFLDKIRLENELLVAMTLMIANSAPKDKDIIVNIVSVLLVNKK